MSKAYELGALKTPWFRGAYWAAVGFLALSSISWDIVRDLIGLSLYVPEIYLVLLVPWISAERLRKTFSALLSPGMFCWYFVWLLLVTIAVLRTGELFDVLRSARAFFVLAAFYACLRCLDLPKLQAVTCLIVGILFGEILSVFLNENRLEDATNGVNLVAMLASGVLLIINPSPFWKAVIGALAPVIVFASGFRATILAFTLGAGVGVLCLYVKRKTAAFQALPRTGRRAQIFGMIGALIIVCFLPIYLADAMAAANSPRYHRIVTRSSALLDGGVSASQDDVRVEIWRRFFAELSFDSLAPRGFATIADGKAGLHNDMPYGQLLEIFGLLVGAPLVLLGLVAIALRAMAEARRARTDAQTLGACVALALPVLMLFNGRIFYITYESALAGVLLGLAYHRQQAEKRLV